MNEVHIFVHGNDGSPMTTAAQTRRRALREKLIDLAEKQISAEGLGSLRARDLAREAGCALGAIYNAVGDLNELVLEVNARTFARLGAHVGAQTPADEPAIERLIAMAQAYHGFAAQNHNAWRALFDIERGPDEAAPDWYLAQMQRLFQLIADPLAELRPGLDAQDQALLTRALFSAVHGIVLLSLDRASAGVPAQEIDRMIALILQNLVVRA